MSLTKTRCILHLVTWKRGIYFAPDAAASVQELQLSKEAFIDMGCPSYVTVTVEPIDKLNEEQE
jgi:hypothetical protein